MGDNSTNNLEEKFNSNVFTENVPEVLKNDSSWLFLLIALLFNGHDKEKPKETAPVMGRRVSPVCNAL